MPNELAGKQTWIDTNMCDDFKIVEDGSTDMLSNDVFENNCPKFDIDPENNDLQNEIEEIFENDNVDFKPAKMKELQSWASNKVYSIVPKTTKKNVPSMGVNNKRNYRWYYSRS